MLDFKLVKEQKNEVFDKWIDHNLFAHIKVDRIIFITWYFLSEDLLKFIVIQLFFL